MSFPQSKIWIMYSAIDIVGLKANFKASYRGDLRCRFCNSRYVETQEHLEDCRVTNYERMGLEILEWPGA